jgi:hypothetical protein
MLEVLGIKNAQKLVPMEDDTRPRDPVTENQNVLKGKPVKAFFYQDHESHIAVHCMAMHDPKIQSVLGQDPNAPQMQAAMQAHINEHLGFEYRKQMEKTMGMQLPNYEDEDDDIVIPKEMENQIAQMAAQASQQLMQQHQQEAQQQQIEQQMQDPVIQMQMQELAIKQAEQKRKVDKDAADAMLKAKQLELEKQRIDAQQETAGAQMAMKHVNDNKRTEAEQEREGFRQGMDFHKARMQREQQQNKPNQPPKKGE